MREVICEECGDLMRQFSFEAISGWACSGCGWSYDDEDSDDEPRNRAGASGGPDGSAVSGALEGVHLGESGVSLGIQPQGLREASAALEGSNVEVGVWGEGTGPLIYTATLTAKNGRSVTGMGYTPVAAEEDAMQAWMRGEG